MPPQFKEFLTSSGDDVINADGDRYYQLISAPFPRIQFEDRNIIQQQVGAEDCAWWAFYNSLAIICTGQLDYMSQFRQLSRKPAGILRCILPEILEVASEHQSYYSHSQ